MAESLRVAVIGCGWAGQIHAEAYARHPRAHLAAVCDPDLEKAQALASRLGLRAYASLEALLEREQVDAVSIASPTETHVALGNTCLRAGAAVLCEKPLSRDTRSARELVETARAAGLPLGVNYNRRFAAGYRKARERVENASRVHFFTSILAQNVPLAQTAEMRVGLPQDFLVFDACSHLLDLACFLVGQKPRRVQAFGSRDLPGQLWTDIQIGLQFEGGAIGSLVVSLTGPECGQLPIERTEIGAETERIIVDNITQAVEWFGYRDSECHRWTPGIFAPVGYVESITASVHAWVDAVSQGNPVPIPGEDGVRVVALCEQVRSCLLAQEAGWGA